MLSCVDLAKTYRSERGEIEAVKGIDIEVRPGEFASVVGRSGSGKSSFLAMIGGLSRPSRGTVRIEDTDIWSLTDDRLANFRNRRIGFVYQFASLLPTLRIIDNVLCRLCSIARRTQRAPTKPPPSRSISWAYLITSTLTRPSSPPANSGGRSSRARSSIHLPCCWPTSRHPISTRRPSAGSWISFGTSTASAASRWSW
jgi:ABC-type lipoprotein export system ATPase subunit